MDGALHCLQQGEMSTTGHPPLECCADVTVARGRAVTATPPIRGVATIGGEGSGNAHKVSFARGIHVSKSVWKLKQLSGRAKAKAVRSVS